MPKVPNGGLSQVDDDVALVEVVHAGPVERPLCCCDVGRAVCCVAGEQGGATRCGDPVHSRVQCDVLVHHACKIEGGK